MALNWEVINENVLNLAFVMNDILDTVDPKDVSWVMKDDNGNVIDTTVPNLAKIIQQLGKGSVLVGNGAPGQDLKTNGVGTLYVDLDTLKLYMVTDAQEDSKGNVTLTWKLVDGIIKDYITETPTVSGPTNITEGTSEKYTITNFNKNYNYSFSALKGTISYNVGDAYFMYNAPNVDSDSTDRITVTASAPGKLASSPAVINVTILNINEEDDQTIVDNDTANNTAESDGVE
jgi:hypothetical protein